MDILTFRNTYWNYYIQMENDFFSFSPYCEIDQYNDKAFSVKYLQLLLSICGEIDTIGKTFCKTLDNSLNLDSCGITDYISILNQQYSTFANETVVLMNYRYRELYPWKSIEKGHIPNWWQSYNAIKHHRDQVKNNKENYKYANQKTTIEALCALYILIQYWAAKNFVRRTEKKTNDHTMTRLKSSRLALKKWDFYATFMGQEPWFEPDLFYKYIEGEKS